MYLYTYACVVRGVNLHVRRPLHFDCAFIYKYCSSTGMIENTSTLLASHVSCCNLRLQGAIKTPLHSFLPSFNLLPYSSHRSFLPSFSRATVTVVTDEAFWILRSSLQILLFSPWQSWPTRLLWILRCSFQILLFSSFSTFQPQLINNNSTT